MPFLFFLHGFSFLPNIDCFGLFLHKQRWAIIRKRLGNSNVGTNPSGSQLSEERRAAHHAITLALMPVKSLTAARPGNLFSILIYLTLLKYLANNLLNSITAWLISLFHSYWIYLQDEEMLHSRFIMNLNYLVGESPLSWGTCLFDNLHKLFICLSLKLWWKVNQSWCYFLIIAFYV